MRKSYVTIEATITLEPSTYNILGLSCSSRSFLLLLALVLRPLLPPPPPPSNSSSCRLAAQRGCAERRVLAATAGWA